MTALDRLARWLLPVARRLPGPLKRPLQRWHPSRASVPLPDDTTYQERLARETEIFAGQEEVHDLPAIFHY